MSALARKINTMTESDYLNFEDASDIKHEYLNGEVFAMAGGSENHSLIGVNLSFILRSQLRGDAPCKPYQSDMRIKIEASTLYTYPDASVACGGSQFADNKHNSLLNPILLIEVLSPSTEAYDRGKKFQEYRKIPSLREYVLIAQDSPHIEHYLLNDKGNWELTEVKGLASSLELPSINCTLALHEVYEQVEFEDDLA